MQTSTPRQIENPVNRERVVFRRTASDTDGECVECDFYMAPGGGSPMVHVHALQEERVRVASGMASCSVGRQRTPSRLAAGESVVILAGTPHRVWNDGDEELHVVIEFRPALDIEGLLAKTFALAAAGKTDRHGRPRLADRVMLAHQHEVFAAGAPVALQRKVVAWLAPLARRFSAATS